jgi:hypothetical protein
LDYNTQTSIKSNLLLSFILSKPIDTADCFSVERFLQSAVFPQSSMHLFVRKGLDMTVIEPSLYIVFERFPQRKETIKALFKNNESFETLCEGYNRCAEARQHWNQSLDEDAPARRHEYRALLRELEEEILQNVNESTYRKLENVSQGYIGTLEGICGSFS